MIRRQREEIYRRFGRSRAAQRETSQCEADAARGLPEAVPGPAAFPHLSWQAGYTALGTQPLTHALVSRDASATPRIATFMGTKFATSTQLSERILDMLNRERWPELPRHTAEWLALQREVSVMPRADRLLIESYTKAREVEHEGEELDSAKG